MRRNRMKRSYYVCAGLLAVAVMLFSGGCSIHHVIADDYSQYLANNEGRSTLPKTEYQAEYVLTPPTADHHYEFRAAMVGYAHVWVVDFGRMLEATLESRDVQAAFKKLTKAKGDKLSDDMTVNFGLIDYRFENFEATINLRISVSRGETVVFDKTYVETGLSQGGKMFWAGPFGMKNAIQQSTKTALDRILAQSLKDMAPSLAG
jgi:hypothetical protein